MRTELVWWTHFTSICKILGKLTKEDQLKMKTEIRKFTKKQQPYVSPAGLSCSMY